MKVQLKLLALFISIVIILSSCTKGNTNKNIDGSQMKTEFTTTAVSKDNAVVIVLGNQLFSLNNRFEDAELDRLNTKELSILRNSIYAKYGYIFSSQEFIEYFSRLKWYSPTSKDVKDKLNSIDMENINKIAEIEKKKKITIKSSIDESDYRFDENGNIIFNCNNKKETLYIARHDIEESDSTNRPIRINLKIFNCEVAFESLWNDGVYVSMADFDDSDNDLDVYITVTGTDIQCTTYIYKFDGTKLYKYAELSHLGREFQYDGKGRIYYWLNSGDKVEFNTYFDYRTMQSESITDEDIKTILNKSK